MSLELVYTDEQKIEFLRFQGYTIKEVNYQEYQDGGRSCEDSIHDRHIILAYKHNMSDDLAELLRSANYIRPARFHFYYEETLSGAFQKEFSKSLLKLLLQYVHC